MSKINYSQWIERARTFSEGLRRLPGEINVGVEIAPPISEEQLEDVSAKWGGRPPAALLSFWREGSAAIDCAYWWKPPDHELPSLHEVFESNNFIYGGVRFFHATNIFPGNGGANPHDKDMLEVFGKSGMELWCRCAVFLHVGNGDCLGLDTSTNWDDPAVVYLLHDGEESGQISPTFSGFLAAWEELCYIGPEFWFLDYWLDWDRGEIDCTKHKTAELRKLLTPRETQATAEQGVIPKT